GGITNYVKAVDDITFSINEGETLSLVGESGCGKSTTGRAILRLDEPTAGSIEFNNENLVSLNKKQLRKRRQDIQIIFQDPYASLNPRQTVNSILTEAMTIQNIIPKKERHQKAIELLKTVGLNSNQ